MRILVLAGLLTATSAAQPRPHTHDAPTRAIEFPDVEGYETLVVDLHMHTVFSDGAVWPSVRVEEALRDGLDVIATTEHLEYQPHSDDIPHPDRNRAFEIMREAADGSDLLVVNGSEITRSMPPGHSNAIFVTDANALLLDDPVAVFREAKRQGAFTFWNHPNWTAQRPDGRATLTDLHRRLIQDGLLDGIEVANDQTFSEEALAIALEHDLTILGTSDVHGLVDWAYDVPEGGHRPVTLAFVRSRTEAGLREALEAGRTVAFFRDVLAGRREHVGALVESSLSVRSAVYRGDSSVLEVVLANRSEAPFVLEHAGALTFHGGTGVITVPAHGTVTLEVKPGSRLGRVEVPFRVLSAVVGPGEHPAWTLVAVPEP